MTVFAAAAGHYDRLYADKDYAAEVDYVDALVQRHRPGARTLLDLGCGTGRHAVSFAEKGYRVLGVDFSADMLALARTRVAALAPALRERIELRQGDVRALDLAQRFEAIVALFHVISYQTTNDDVIAALKSARARLAEGGVLVFDCWYGPGVLTDLPATRVKRVGEGAGQVVRVAEPVMHLDENIVDVEYQFFVGDDAGRYADFRETHTMRYFFIPELRLMLDETGWEPVEFCEWMTDRKPSATAWNLTVVARHRSAREN